MISLSYNDPNTLKHAEVAKDESGGDVFFSMGVLQGSAVLGLQLKHTSE